jgi:hypothetical protein
MKLPLTLLVAACLATGSACAAPIVSYVLENQSSSIERDVPVTFGVVLAPGDVPSGSSIAVVDKSGNPVPFQVDAKARNRDGSLRHAVVTVSLSRLSSGRDETVSIVSGSQPQGAPVPTSALPGNFDATVELNEQGNRLTSSARDLLARGKLETWLSGPLVSEWWVSAPLRDSSGKPDPLLSVRYGIRSYGPGRPVRIEVDVENAWTWPPNPRTRGYDVEIRLGGKSVYSKQGVVHQAHTRWRKVFWWDAAPDVFVKQDLAYLKKTRAIPNYDPDLSPSLDSGMYRKFANGNHDIMAAGVIYPYMAVTGGRPDIAALPAWTVNYLLTMDPRAAEMTMSAGDLAGSFSTHFRNEKTGRPATSEEFPKISTHYNYVGHGNGNLPRPDFGTFNKGLGPESAHEPSVAFVPYMVTGDRYYLEELQFWSQWNSWGTAPEYHGFEKSLIGWDQIRGQGWSLRTLAQTAYITPDSDPMKATLLRELHANAEWYDKTYTNNPGANVFHVALRQSDEATAFAPWMDDFLTWATTYTVQLGFEDWRPFARWKAYSPVQRMINPDYCYVMATKYYIKVMDNPHQFIGSWADLFFANLPKPVRDQGQRPACGSDDMAAAFKLQRAGEMMGGAREPGGYPSQMQPALAGAVDVGVPGAAQAWEKFRSRSVQPKGGVLPQWAIVPFASGR